MEPGGERAGSWYRLRWLAAGTGLVDLGRRAAPQNLLPKTCDPRAAMPGICS
jgi:hypothetical protein